MSSRTVSIETKHGYANIPGTLECAGPKSTDIVLLYHGIFVDRNENGRFKRLAPMLSTAGFDSLRIDLSGHGESGVPSVNARLSRMCSEVLDVIEWASRSSYNGISILASSFSGALVSLALATPAALPRPHKIVYLNPVLDFDNAFIHAERDEMAEMFSPDRQREAYKHGSFQPTPEFTMSREFLMELTSTDVRSAYLSMRLPHLVLHGTADELISFEHTRDVVTQNASASFEAIEDGVHAFTQSGHEDMVWERVMSWLTQF
jgi:alpha-beta hydrolase superfamily lysophospholipase